MSDDAARLYDVSTGKEVSRDFTMANLAMARFPSLKLAGAIFDDAKLNGADGSGAYLQNASFQRANLSKAKFTLTDFRGANFTAANLKGADLSSAVLREADLTDADLSNARLTKAMLTAATLTNANLAGADLRGAKDVTVAMIHGARNWQQAVFDPPTAKLLAVTQEEQVGRHGRRASESDCLCVEVLTGATNPTFGDLFQITGETHPRYAPSGRCDMLPLARLGFEQVDDAFAIRLRDEEVIWLLPVEHHQPGTLRALRVELTSQQKRAGERFLQAIEALLDVFQAGVMLVPASGPTAPLEVVALRSLVQARCGKRQV